MKQHRTVKEEKQSNLPFIISDGYNTARDVRTFIKMCTQGKSEREILEK